MHRFGRFITLFVMLMAISVLLLSCGPTYEERQAAEEAETERKRSESLKEDARIRSELESRHGKTLGLAEAVQSNAYTYELQQFFAANREKIIYFKAFLDDIEITASGSVAEFSSALGRDIDPLVPNVIIFRLNVRDDQARRLLQASRPEEPFFRMFRSFLGPKLTVLARIDSVSRLRRYEFQSRSGEDEGGSEPNALDIDVPLRFIAFGSLVEVIEPRTDAPEVPQSDLRCTPGENTRSSDSTGAQKGVGQNAGSCQAAPGV